MRLLSSEKKTYYFQGQVQGRREDAEEQAGQDRHDAACWEEEGGQCYAADLPGRGRGHPPRQGLQLRLRDRVPREARGGVPHQAGQRPHRALQEEGAPLRHKVSVSVK